MKRNYSIGLALVVMIFALTVSILPVHAHQTDEEHTHPVTKVDNAATKAKERTDRIAERKAKLTTRLTVVQQARIQARCKNAQTLLKVTIDKATKVQNKRDKIHTDILDKLTKLEVKLAASGVDTTELKTQIADLKIKIEKFKTDSAAFLEAAQDTAELDCQTDPTGFRASLDAARAELKQLHTDVVTIRTTLAKEIKPRLVAAKTALEAKKAEQ